MSTSVSNLSSENSEDIAIITNTYFTECSLCCCSMFNRVNVLACGHMYHTLCIDDWSKHCVENRRPFKCPNCNDTSHYSMIHPFNPISQSILSLVSHFRDMAWNSASLSTLVSLFTVYSSHTNTSIPGGSHSTEKDSILFVLNQPLPLSISPLLVPPQTVPYYAFSKYCLYLTVILDEFIEKKKLIENSKDSYPEYVQYMAIISKKQDLERKKDDLRKNCDATKLDVERLKTKTVERQLRILEDAGVVVDEIVRSLYLQALVVSRQCVGSIYQAFENALLLPGFDVFDSTAEETPGEVVDIPGLIRAVKGVHIEVSSQKPLPSQLRPEVNEHDLGGDSVDLSSTSGSTSGGMSGSTSGSTSGGMSGSTSGMSGSTSGGMSGSTRGGFSSGVRVVRRDIGVGLGNSGFEGDGWGDVVYSESSTSVARKRRGKTRGDGGESVVPEKDNEGELFEGDLVTVDMSKSKRQKRESQKKQSNTQKRRSKQGECVLSDLGGNFRLLINYNKYVFLTDLFRVRSTSGSSSMYRIKPWLNSSGVLMGMVNGVSEKPNQVEMGVDGQYRTIPSIQLGVSSTVPELESRYSQFTRYIASHLASDADSSRDSKTPPAFSSLTWSAIGGRPDGTYSSHIGASPSLYSSSWFRCYGRTKDQVTALDEGLMIRYAEEDSLRHCRSLFASQNMRFQLLSGLSGEMGDIPHLLSDIDLFVYGSRQQYDLAIQGRGFGIGGSGFDTLDWERVLVLLTVNLKDESAYPNVFLNAVKTIKKDGLQRYIHKYTHYNYLRGVEHDHTQCNYHHLNNFISSFPFHSFSGLFDYDEEDDDEAPEAQCFHAPLSNAIDDFGILLHPRYSHNKKSNIDSDLSNPSQHGNVDSSRDSQYCLFLSETLKHLPSYVEQIATGLQPALNRVILGSQYRSDFESTTGLSSSHESTSILNELRLITLDLEIITRLWPTHRYLAHTLYSLGLGRYGVLQPYPSSSLLWLVECFGTVCFDCLDPIASELLSHLIWREVGKLAKVYYVEKAYDNRGLPRERINFSNVLLFADVERVDMDIPTLTHYNELLKHMKDLYSMRLFHDEDFENLIIRVHREMKRVALPESRYQLTENTESDGFYKQVTEKKEQSGGGNGKKQLASRRKELLQLQFGEKADGDHETAELYVQLTNDLESRHWTQRTQMMRKLSFSLSCDNPNVWIPTLFLASPNPFHLSPKYIQYLNLVQDLQVQFNNTYNDFSAKYSMSALQSYVHLIVAEQTCMFVYRLTSVFKHLCKLVAQGNGGFEDKLESVRAHMNKRYTRYQKLLSSFEKMNVKLNAEVKVAVKKLDVLTLESSKPINVGSGLSKSINSRDHSELCEKGKMVVDMVDEWADCSGNKPAFHSEKSIHSSVGGERDKDGNRHNRDLVDLDEGDLLCDMLIEKLRTKLKLNTASVEGVGVSTGVSTVDSTVDSMSSSMDELLEDLPTVLDADGHMDMDIDIEDSDIDHDDRGVDIGGEIDRDGRVNTEYDIELDSINDSFFFTSTTCTDNSGIGGSGGTNLSTNLYVANTNPIYDILFDETNSSTSVSTGVSTGVSGNSTSVSTDVSTGVSTDVSTGVSTDVSTGVSGISTSVSTDVSTSTDYVLLDPPSPSLSPLLIMSPAVKKEYISSSPSLLERSRRNNVKDSADSFLNRLQTEGRERRLMKQHTKINAINKEITAKVDLSTHIEEPQVGDLKSRLKARFEYEVSQSSKKPLFPSQSPFSNITSVISLDSDEEGDEKKSNNLDLIELD